MAALAARAEHIAHSYHVRAIWTESDGSFVSQRIDEFDRAPLVSVPPSGFAVYDGIYHVEDHADRIDAEIALGRLRMGAK